MKEGVKKERGIRNDGEKREDREGKNRKERGDEKRKGKLYLYTLNFSSHKEFCRPQGYSHLQSRHHILHLGTPSS